VLPVLLTDTVSSDLDRALHYTLLWGLEGVAIRSVGGPGDRVPHVNEERLRRRLDEAELPIVSVDPGLFEGASQSRASWMNDLAALPETLAFCRRVGAPRVVVGALAGEEADRWDALAAGRALAQAGDAAASVGLTLLVPNAAGTACATGAQLAAVLEAADHPAVGALWSPADALVAARVPLLAVTVRDLKADGAWQEAVPGEGEVGWADQLATLVQVGFEGPLVLEVRARPAAPFGLQAGAALQRLVRAARRAS
jgi:sugar phosphate isomerase/epimerase